MEPSRPLTILSVAYPLAPVGFDGVGGAEQVLTQLDSALTRAGHRSLVVACEGSVTAGTLLATPRPAKHSARGSSAEVWSNHGNAIRHALERWPVDLVHLHGVDFHGYLPPPGPPVLATLHLPPDWYPPAIFQMRRPNTWLHCVSAAQRRACPPCAQMLPEIGNGVPPELARGRHAKRRFALALGRICPEKGYHLALDAAAETGMPLLLGGQVFPYPSHESYFESEIRPRLGKNRRFLGPVGLRRKRRLLTAARCLVVPSLVPETSSLVAMEALAAGTPVVAFPAGALCDLIDHGRTGFLVESRQQLGTAMLKSRELNPEDCRRAARARFSLDRTVSSYFKLYHQLIAQGDRRQPAGPGLSPARNGQEVGLHPD